MKKYLIPILVVIIIIVAVVVFYKPAEKGTIKIGFSTALTGPVQMPGNWALKGAQLAAKELNSQGKKVEIIVEDDMCNPTESTKTFNKFINVDNINKIFIFCSAAIPSTTIISKDKSFVLYSSIKVTDQSNYFTLYPDINLEMNVLTDYIYNNKNISRIAQIYQMDAAGQAIKEAFVHSFESLGGEVVFSEGVSNFDSGDFKTLLLKIKNQNIKGVMLTGAVGNFIKAIKQANEMGLSVSFFSNSLGAENPTVITQLGDLSEGIVFSAPYKENISSDFEKKYFEEYNEKPGVWSALAYDSIFVFVSINKKCGENTSCFEKEISKIEFNGASGKFNFNDDQSTDRKIFLKEIQNGQFKVLNQ